MPTIEDILTTKGPDVIVAECRATVSEAAKMMAHANVGSVIVKDSGGVLGIFTERDLLRRVIACRKDPSSVLLGEVMSSPVKSCRLGDEVQDCADMLTKLRIRHLAVIEEGELVGLIGLRDMLIAELRSSEENIQALQPNAW